jgi:hypothetical protein
MSVADHSSTSHPSPQRQNVDVRLLLGGLAAGPAGWIVQLVVSYAVSSNACSAARAQEFSSGSAFHHETGALLAVNLLCLLLVVVGGLISYRNWRSTRGETGGDAESALTIGEGRTRFIALCGILSAGAFAIGILFNTLEPFTVPGCWTGA